MADSSRSAKSAAHLHHRTDEGFYVLEGRLCLVIDDKQTVYEPCAFVLVRRGQRQTFWNPGERAAVFLTLISPSGFEAYFAELAAGLARAGSSDETVALRNQLSTQYDVEVVGPPLFDGH